MRGAVHIGLLFLVVALGMPGKATARKSDVPQAGIFLYSLTNGATLSIDGKMVGVVPLEGLLSLTPGQHTIKLIRRGFAQRMEVVELAPGEELELEWDLVPFAGVVQISSNVEKAALWLNGKPFGEIPFDGEIPMGEHKISAVAPGYTAVEKEVEINGGVEYSFRLDMEIAPITPVAVESRAPLYQQWWFWTATGTVIVGGVVAGLILMSDDAAAPPQAEVSIKL